MLLNTHYLGEKDEANVIHSSGKGDNNKGGHPGPATSLDLSFSIYKIRGLDRGVVRFPLAPFQRSDKNRVKFTLGKFQNIV